MLDDREFTKRVMQNMFSDLDTPAPWDVDDEFVRWAFVWGDFAEHWIVANTDGSYTVGEDLGDVYYFDGVVETLDYIKSMYAMEA